MKEKLGNYIAAVFFTVLSIATVLGTISLLTINRMAHDIDDLGEARRDVDIINSVDSKAHEITHSIHDFIAESDFKDALNSIRLLLEMEDEVTVYKERMEAKSHPQSLDEVNLLEEVQEKLAKIKEKIIPLIENPDITEKPSSKIRRANLARVADDVNHFRNDIQRLTSGMNSLHFNVIDDIVNDSYRETSFIHMIYMVFSISAILVSYIGYRLLVLHTILPIKELAFATQRIADGDMSVRVYTKLKTEIGVLYKFFNSMAARVQGNEERLSSFNRELEEEVAERTSELESAYEALRNAHTDLVRMERIATLGQIATTVNHEIRTPLNSLYLNLQLLRKKINKFENQDDQGIKNNMYGLTLSIEGEITRINEILEEFVRYARFSPPELEGKDLNKIIRNVAEIISQNARESNIEIKLSLSEDTGLVMFDEKKMIQALMNLCVNAIHAMPYGGTLSIKTIKEKENVKIYISDTGKGIAEKDMSRIFEPFFTKKAGGLGFGLSIVQRIIEDHHGKIRCRSRIDKGTAFEIVLPLDQGIGKS